MTPAPGEPFNFARDVLAGLVSGADLTRAQAREALDAILAGSVDAPLIASFLTALTAKGETEDEMTGFVDAMMNAATVATVRPDAIDIVGTGGDQLHTVNISTMASLVVAGGGVPVAKHGNRAASGSVGSADVLEQLGVRLDAPGDVVVRCVAEAGIGFFFAPTSHHALKYLAPIRRQLGFRTIFNVLGPLANPAQVRRAVIGVSQARHLEPMAAVLLRRGVDRAFLVNGDDGLDELSLATPSTLFAVSPEGYEQRKIDAPTELGIRHTIEQIRGGNADDNATIVQRFVEGRRGAIFDVVCANAALGFMVADKASTLREGFDLAVSTVETGGAARALADLIRLSNS